MQRSGVRRPLSTLAPQPRSFARGDVGGAALSLHAVVLLGPARPALLLDRAHGVQQQEVLFVVRVGLMDEPEVVLVDAHR